MLDSYAMSYKYCNPDPTSLKFFSLEERHYLLAIEKGSLLPIFQYFSDAKSNSSHEFAHKTLHLTCID